MENLKERRIASLQEHEHSDKKWLLCLGVLLTGCGTTYGESRRAGDLI
jgi:hypothetical protein